VSSKANLSRLELRAASEQTGQEVTFRDPAGQLFLTPTYALRRIHPAAVKGTLAFLESPLRASLEGSGDLIESEILSASNSPAGEELWLRHPRIDPISYPWEWTTAQWVAGAELTLRVAMKAVAAGWTLKDATPLNVVFRGPKPVLVDVLSLERLDSSSSTWLAYGQFVRTFLLPLIAEKYLNWPLQATLFHRDGYEPSLLYRSLKPWQRLHPDLLDVVTLATLLENKSGGNGARRRSASSVRNPELARHILSKRLARLGKQVRRAAKRFRDSQWSTYEKAASHYSTSDKDDKQRFVVKALERCRPSCVLDIGSNTGTYSLLAAEMGAEVVAIDNDAKAIEMLWATAARQGKAVTGLVANLARPTPAAGWMNCEQLSLLDRLEGKADLVLMLAVIHHLILREQVPLGHIGELCAALTRRWLLIEWVPTSDPMFQEWLRGREDLYGHLTENDLIHAFKPRFQLTDRMVLSNKRVLLLFENHHIGDQRLRVNEA
jgi:SAM-dependent methyltransferase